MPADIAASISVSGCSAGTAGTASSAAFREIGRQRRVCLLLPADADLFTAIIGAFISPSGGQQAQQAQHIVDFKIDGRLAWWFAACVCNALHLCSFFWESSLAVCGELQIYEVSNVIII